MKLISSLTLVVFLFLVIPFKAYPDDVHGVVELLPKYGRYIHRFNRAFYSMFVMPISFAYDSVAPSSVHKRISNFVEWGKEPLSSVNYLLQGNYSSSFYSVSRFTINGIIGVLGIFDVASYFSDKLHPSQVDFASTLRTWNIYDHYYLELPFFGPSTDITVFSNVLSYTVDTPCYNFICESDNLRNSYEVGTALTISESVGKVVKFYDMPDSYILFRDAWLRRNNMYAIGESAYDIDLDEF